MPNGVATDYTYDDLNRLADVVQTDQWGAILLSEHYTLNADGTRWAAHEEQMQSSYFTLVTESTWTYDDDGRLTNEEFVNTSDTSESYDNSFTYDLAGNRVHQTRQDGGGNTVETIDYGYDERNELTTQTSNVSGETDFTYDANGSELTSTTGSNVTTYTFDVRNRMAGYQGGTTTASYVYDDAGNRVRETVNGTTTYYLTDTRNPTGVCPAEAKTL